jgi:Fe-S-cluster containining protein
MTQDWVLRIEEICMKCSDYYCCDGACPPISENRYNLLIKNGVSPDYFEFKGYRRLKIKKDNKCIFFCDGKCSIHNIKPETCQAGPLTFDIMGDKIEIFLKYESICPVVHLLKEDPEAYNQQYLHAIEQISSLVYCLPENELSVICRIDEPLTEKVAEIPLRRNGTL